MAEPGIGVDIPFGRFDPATAGKFEPIPDLYAQAIKDFQIGTNLVETRWVNQYQYNMAQQELGLAAAKLRGAGTDADLLQQQYDQRKETFPMQQQAYQQSLDQNKMLLDQQKYEFGQRQKAQGEMADYQKEFNAIDWQAPDWMERKSALDQKYPEAAYNPYTMPQVQDMAARVLARRQGSSLVQQQADELGALEAARRGGILPPGDYNRVVAEGRAGPLIQQANQKAAEARINQIIDSAKGSQATDSSAAQDITDMQQLESELANGRREVGGQIVGRDHFYADGRLDPTVNNRILALERKYGLSEQFPGSTMEIADVMDQTTGQMKRGITIKGLKVSPESIGLLNGLGVGAQPTQQTGKPPAAGPTNTQIASYMNADKDYQAALAAHTAEKEKADRTRSDADIRAWQANVQKDYQDRRVAKGLPPMPSGADILANKQSAPTTRAAGGIPPPVATQVTPGQTPPAAAPPPTGRHAGGLLPGSAVPPTGRGEKIKMPRAEVAGEERFAWNFPADQARPGTWQAAWNETLGRTFGGPTQEETSRAVQESLGRGAAWASTERGVPAGYESPSPSPRGGGGGDYTPPSNAPDVAGINPRVWGMVMREEGPEFDRDGGHPAVFGLWGDKSGVESQAYQTVRQYGSHSPEAYQAVTRAWTQGFLQPSRPWELRSAGMQGLVISDSQHQGGYAAERIIREMGGWDAINQMDPREAIAEYSRLRTGLWGGNQARVRREEAWALANT